MRMTITQRYISLILVATLLPILAIAIFGLFLMQNTASQMIDLGTQALLETEKEVLLQKARLNAMKISAFLKTYEDQVEIVRRSVSTASGRTPLSTPQALKDRYPADTNLLPGYGYVHPQYGTYANWDMLVGKSSPLIRRAVVDRIRTDETFRKRALGLLEQIMPAVPLMEGFHSLHPDAVDLVWIILTDGIGVTYPNDYATRMAINPSFNELDEAEEDYVRLFDATHNPQRKMKWMPPYRDAIKRIWMVSCVAPLYNDNAFIGTIGFDVLLQAMTEQIQQMRIGENGYTLLLSAEGHPIALSEKAINDFFGDTLTAANYLNLFSHTSDTSNKPEGEVTKLADTCLPAMKSLASTILAHPNGIKLHDTASERMVFASASVQETGWIIVAAMPLAEINVPIARLLERSRKIFLNGGFWILCLLMVVAVTAALIGSYLSLRTTRPLHSLIADIDSIGRDSNWRQVSSGTDDEFKLLADSVNRMVETIQKSERKYTNIFNNVRETFFETSVDGFVIDISPSVEILAKGQYNRSDLLGKPLSNFYVNLDTRPSFVDLLLHQGYVTDFDVQLKNRDGSVVDCWLSAKLTHAPEGGPATIIGSLTDISERKNAEAEREKLQMQLIQSQKMDAIGRLAGGVAHDFNNMLSVIIGHTQLAMLTMDENHSLFQRLTGIHEAASRAADLTRQLLAFARKQTIALQIFDLNKTVEGMLNMLRRLIGENITLSWCPGKDLASIKMDPSQIDQILVNLCVNARDSIPGTGKIIIETDSVSLDEAYCSRHTGFVPGDYIQLVVSDTGCGMDAKTLSLLFEPFYTTKATGKGTGLGMAMIYGIVKQNNGFINVYSEPDKGTTFRLYFPRCSDRADPQSGNGRKEATPRGDETILLVEDGPMILDITKTMLEAQGYTVLAAATPEQALNLAKEHAGEIDLLLTDVIMPEMNGRDLSMHILRYYPNIRAMFMSGYTANVIAHHGVLEEGVHFIQKPFSMQDLSTKIRETLSRGKSTKAND